MLVSGSVEGLYTEQTLRISPPSTATNKQLSYWDTDGKDKPTQCVQARYTQQTQANTNTFAYTHICTHKHAHAQDTHSCQLVIHFAYMPARALPGRSAQAEIHDGFMTTVHKENYKMDSWQLLQELPMPIMAISLSLNWVGARHCLKCTYYTWNVWCQGIIASSAHIIQEMCGVKALLPQVHILKRNRRCMWWKGMPEAHIQYRRCFPLYTYLHILHGTPAYILHALDGIRIKGKCSNVAFGMRRCMPEIYWLGWKDWWNTCKQTLMHWSRR
jgi:hypothetical protein